ncbi:MAG: cadherin domain-containing protein [Pirellulaceae bacterium]|nr:cadherin domain-containing protein [Pirellulaceae bacterium]
MPLLSRLMAALRKRRAVSKRPRAALLEPQLAVVRLESRRVLAAPTIDASDAPLAYTEGGGAVAVDSMVTVTDDDGTLESASVRIVGGYQMSQDLLAAPDDPLDNITIGAFNPATGTITLTGSDSVAAYQAALRSVTYENTSQAPSTADRSIEFTVMDDMDSAQDSRTVNVTAVNDAPMLLDVAGTVTFDEQTVNAGPVVIDSNVTFTDPDIAGGSLTVSYSSGGQAQDQLGIRNQGMGAGQIGVSGPNVFYGGTQIGMIDALNTGANGDSLRVDFNGMVTQEAVDALIQNITYANNSNTPTLSRTVMFSVNDGSGAMNDTVSAQTMITVTAFNDPPTIMGATVSIDENSPNGTAVHTMVANDPEATPAQLQFSIVSQSVPGALAIDATSGQITVLDSSLLDFEMQTSIALTVQVSDQGQAGSGGPKTATALVTVNLNNLADVFTVGGGGFARLILIEDAGVTYLHALDEMDDDLVPRAVFAQINEVRVDLSALPQNDTLVIDFSGGNPIPTGKGVTFLGGPTGTDMLILEPGMGDPAFDTIQHLADTNIDGSIVIDGVYRVVYDDVDQVEDVLSAQNREFSFLGAGETIELRDDSMAGNNRSRIDSTRSAQITFLNPIDANTMDMTPATLTVNTTDGSGADTLNVLGLDSMFSADLTIVADSDPGELDTVRFQTTGTSLGGGDLSVAAHNVVFDRPVTSAVNVSVVAGNDINFNAGGQILASSMGLVTLTAGGQITDADTALDIMAGSLALRAATGIGSANPLEAAVTTLAFRNTASGAVRIDNTGGLTIGAVDGLLTSTNTGAGAGRNVILRATSPVTFAVDTIAAGMVSASALETVLPMPVVNVDNITVAAGVTVQSTGADVSLMAGDRVIISTTGTVQAATSVTIMGGVADNDMDGLLMLDGSIVAGTSASLTTPQGDISLGSVTAGTTVLVDTDLGSILDHADDALADIMAGGLITLNATANIQGPGADGRLDLAAGSSVDASSETAGAIALRGLGALTLSDVDTANGSIDVLAAGAILATAVDALTAGSDVALVATSGDITVNHVTAAGGAAGDDVTITAQSGSILDDGSNAAGSRITGGLVTLTATGSIGASGASNEIDTAAVTLDVTAGSGGGAGSIFLGELDGVELADIDTASGSITIATGGATTVTAVDAGGAGSDVSLTASTGDVTVNHVTAGTGAAGDDVTITAQSGSILDDGSNAAGSRITGGLVTLTATGSIGASGAGNEIDTAAVSLDVSAGSGGGAGSIFLGELDAVTLADVDTASGSITIATGGATTVTAVDVGGAGSDVTLTVGTGDVTVNHVTAGTGAAGDDVTITAQGGSILDDGSNAAGSRITGGLVTLTATGSIGASGASNEIDTAALTLDVSAGSGGGAGSIFLGELNGVELADIDTASGSITITTGGATTVTAVDAGGAGSDVSLTVSTGDVTVNHVTAGTGAAGDDVTITAQGGSILDDGSNAAGSRITGGLVTLTATGSIGASGASNEIDTAAVTLDVSAGSGGGAGSIFLDELNGVTLTDIDTASGSITIATGGATTVTAVDAGGAGSDVTLTVSTGDVTVNHVSAGSGAAGDDVTITAQGGSILDDGSNAAGSRITGGLVTLTATGSIGASGASNEVDTAAVTLDVSAGSGGGAGSIFLGELDAVTLADIDTADGSITMTTGGATTVTAVDAGGAGSDVSLTASTGDITVNHVTADTGAAGDDVTITAQSGSILDDGSNAAGSRITGGLVTLTATGAIGASGAGNEIDTAAVTLDVSAGSGGAAGAIFLGELDAVTLTDIDTANGSITIATGGATTVTAIDAGGAGSDVSLTVSSGDITVNHVTAGSGAAGNDVTITAQSGSILDDGSNAAGSRITGGLVTLTATGAIGASGASNEIDTAAISLDVTAGSGGGAGAIFLGELDAVTLADVDTADGSITVTTGGATTVTAVDAGGAGSDVTLTVSTGDITVNHVTAGSGAAGDDVTITAQSGSILDDGSNAAGSRITGGLVTLTATGSIGASGASNEIDTAAVSLDVTAGSGGAAGAIFLGELDAATLADIDTANGSITIATGGATAVTAIDAGGAGSDVSLTVSSGDITVNHVTAGSGAAGNDVTIIAQSGSILDDGSNSAGSRITGGLVTLTATGSIGASGASNEIDTAAITLDVSAGSGGGAGSIFLGELNGVELADIDTASGSITIATGGATMVTAVDAGGAGSDVTLTASTGDVTVNHVTAGTGAAGDDVTITAQSGSILDDGSNAAGSRITGGLVTLTAAEDIGSGALDGQIDTAAIALDVSAGAGSIFLGELNAVTLADIDTVDGSITITTGGATTVTAMDAGGAGSDVTLTASTGDITVNHVTAGSGAAGNDVTITAQSGSILDDGSNAASSRITGGLVTLTATGAIGASGASNEIDTAAITLNVTAGSAGGAGSIFLGELDAVTLAGVDTANGAITVVAAGTITATDVDSSATGNGANTIHLNATSGDIVVGQVDAGAMNDVRLDAAGDILEDGLAGTRITAHDAYLQGTNIGQIASFEDFIAGVGTPITIDLSGMLMQALTSDAAEIAVIYLQFVGDFHAAMDSITPDAMGEGWALIRAQNIDVSDPSMMGELDAFNLDANDSVGLDAVDMLTLDDNGLDLNEGTLRIAGVEIVDDVNGSTLGGTLEARNLIINAADAGVLTSFITNADTLSVSLTTGNLRVENNTGDLEIRSIVATDPGSTLTLVENVGVIRDTATTAPSIQVAGTLELQAAGGMGGDGTPLDVRAATIDATVTGNGSMFLHHWASAASVAPTLNLTTLMNGQIMFVQDVEMGHGPLVRDLILGTIVATDDGVIESGMTPDDNVTLINRIGGIIDDGDAGAVDVVADRLVMLAAGGIGQELTGGPLETRLDWLSARAGSGGIAIENSSPGAGNFLRLDEVVVDGTTINGLEAPLGRLPSRGDLSPLPTLTIIGNLQPMQGVSDFDAVMGDPNGTNYTSFIDWCNGVDCIPGSISAAETRTTVFNFNSLPLQQFDQAYLDSPIPGFPNEWRILVRVTASPDIMLMDDGVQLTVDEVAMMGPIDSFASLNVDIPTPTPPDTASLPLVAVVFAPSSEAIAAPTAPALDQAVGGISGGQELERIYVLRIVKANGEDAQGSDVRLQADVLSDLEETLSQLPDDRYRLYLIREDQTEELVREFEIRGGRILEKELQLAPQIQQQRDEGAPAEGAALPEGTQPDGGAIVPNRSGAASDADGGAIVPNRSGAASDADGGAIVPNRSGMAVAIGAAWLARGSAGRWEQQVDTALRSPRRASLGPAARLWKRAARRN